MSTPPNSPRSTIPRTPSPNVPGPQRSTRPLDPFSVSDCILYPELIDQCHTTPRPGWWRRLRHALADRLDDEETEDRESRVRDTRMRPRISTLTPREREILKLLAEGNSVKEIAVILGLSVKTVEAHKFNLMRKLDIHNKAQLVTYAIQKKIIKIPVNQ